MREIKAKVTSSTSVLIKSEKEGHSLNHELIAVNWFNTKVEWLYHLYNSLASRSVINIGGKPLFKANVSENIGDDTYRRDIILIVKYPNGLAFKKLLESTYFKVVSLLRIIAVQRFTFSFTKAVSKQQFDKTSVFYAIHNYTSEIGSEYNLVDLDEVQNRSISVLYRGYSFAYLNQISVGSDDVQIESIIDNVIIYGADNKEDLVNYLTSDSYESKFNYQLSQYKGLLKRIF